MPYKETHEITIGPITLPAGVTLSTSVVVGTGGQQSVTITAATETSKENTAALLEKAFAMLMIAASGEGVGQPVFQSLPPLPPMQAQPGVAAPTATA